MRFTVLVCLFFAMGFLTSGCSTTQQYSASPMVQSTMGWSSYKEAMNKNKKDILDQDGHYGFEGNEELPGLEGYQVTLDDENLMALDRVNVWPFLYYSRPVLSVVWPLFAKAGKNHSLVPLYDWYEDKKVLTIGTIFHWFPSLMKFDGTEKYWRVLNIEHDKQDGNFFLHPIYYAKRLEEGKSWLLFPVLYIRSNNDPDTLTRIWSPIYMQSETEDRTKKTIPFIYNKIGFEGTGNKDESLLFGLGYKNAERVSKNGLRKKRSSIGGVLYIESLKDYETQTHFAAFHEEGFMVTEQKKCIGSGLVNWRKNEDVRYSDNGEIIFNNTENYTLLGLLNWYVSKVGPEFGRERKHYIFGPVWHDILKETPSGERQRSTVFMEYLYRRELLETEKEGLQVSTDIFPFIQADRGGELSESFIYGGLDSMGV